MDPRLIPALDPNPLPAPYWLFKVLLIVTFFLHILAMNFLVGGAFLALLAKRTKREHSARIFSDVAKKLPSFLPATITIGIAPLLFLQVIYGQFFYTSTIIMGWPWLLVLALLTVAYYGFYYASFKRAEFPERASNTMLISFLMVFAIGFLYSNMATLTQSPARWAAKYFANPTGWHLNLGDPTLVPRYLHFFIAAIAVGGLLLAFIGIANWQRDNAYARAILTFGGKAFMFATMAQYLVGFWFFIALPREQRLLFMGGSVVASVLFAISFAGGLATIFLMSAGLRKEDPRRATYTVSALTGVVVLAMIIARDLLRDSYLHPYYHPEQFASRTQWSVLPLFLLLFLGGVALWLVMLKRYFAAPSAARTASAD